MNLKTKQGLLAAALALTVATPPAWAQFVAPPPLAARCPSAPTNFCTKESLETLQNQCNDVVKRCAAPKLPCGEVLSLSNKAGECVQRAQVCALMLPSPQRLVKNLGAGCNQERISKCEQPQSVPGAGAKKPIF